MKTDLLRRNFFILGVLIMVCSIVIGGLLWKWQTDLLGDGASEEKPLEGLQKFGAVPAFSLTEKDGRAITLSELKGKVWMVNFIYTNCPDTCPIQSAQMRQIQDDFRTEKDLRLVSITVDPTRDTPEVLSKYANRFSADPKQWLFLTGNEEAIYKFAQNGFHLGALELPHDKRPESGATHTHSPRFVLVDRDAQIRGYYVSTEPDAMKRLQRDLKILLLASDA
jgi:cytochrome oxidase Cu insertion factor (SCO1/SenC/PrrC family)